MREEPETPRRTPLRVAWHVEIVNNKRKLIWQFPVHLCHGTLGRPDRPLSRPDLMTLQRLAEPAAAPEGRAGGPEKWHKVAVFRAFFEHPYSTVTGEV